MRINNTNWKSLGKSPTGTTYRTDGMEMTVGMAGEGYQVHITRDGQQIGWKYCEGQYARRRAIEGAMAEAGL